MLTPLDGVPHYDVRVSIYVSCDLGECKYVIAMIDSGEGRGCVRDGSVVGAVNAMMS
jgi:hypothetical protein